MANLKAQIGINPQKDFIKAEKFLHQEIFPLLGIENVIQSMEMKMQQKLETITNGNMESL